MNTKNTWWIIGALVVVLAVGYLMMNRQQSPSTVAGDAQVAESKTPQSLKDLMTSGRPMKCEFKDDASEMKTAGTVYVSGKKVRVDFAVTEKEKVTNSHMIVDDTTAYTWMEGQKEGYKLSISEEDKAKAENQTVDPDKKMDYACEKWSGDQSSFAVPADIKFQDLNAMMPSVNAQGNGSGALDVKALQCAACDQAPEASRAQCKQALGC